MVQVVDARGILCAMGEDVKIVARFPHGEILITRFEDFRRRADIAQDVAVP